MTKKEIFDSYDQTYSFLPLVQSFLKVVKVWRSFLKEEKEEKVMSQMILLVELI